MFAVCIISVFLVGMYTGAGLIVFIALRMEKLDFDMIARLQTHPSTRVGPNPFN